MALKLPDDAGQSLNQLQSRARGIWWYPAGQRVDAAGRDRRADAPVADGRAVERNVPDSNQPAPVPIVRMPDIPNAVGPNESPRGFRRYLIHSTQRHGSAFGRYFSTRTNDLAAIIAFNGLIAVVPMVLLVMAIAGVLLRNEGMLLDFERAVISVFPSANARTALENAVAARQNAGWLSIVSLIGFVWIGSSFVATVTRAINNLYDLRGHPFVHSRLRGTIVIFAFSVLLMAAVLAGTLPTLVVGRDVPFSFAHLWIFHAFAQFVSYATSLIAAFGLFMVAYRFLPSLPQRWVDVMPGAGVASVGLLLLTQMFPIYVRIYQGLPSSSAYGAAFVFVSILVTWSYLLAHVLLIGAWLNARAEERRQSKRLLQMTHLDTGEALAGLPSRRPAPHEPPPMPERPS